jgi:peptidoglycan/LPS O-acetylase OafA/YrhL
LLKAHVECLLPAERRRGGVIGAMARKLAFVEGMRGAAAMVVCVAHFIDIFLPEVYDTDKALKSWGIREHQGAIRLINVFLNPHLAVCVFFVLSGYILSRGLLGEGNRGRLAHAGLKRFPRLMLPALASVLLAWTVLEAGGFHYGPVRNLTGAVAANYLAAPRSFLYALFQGSLGAFFVWDPSLIGDDSLNPVLWTIGVELYGSFLVFLVLAGFRRRALGYAAVALAFFNTYYLAFPIGMALAELRVSARGRTGLALASAAFGLALGSYPYHGETEEFWRWLPTPPGADPVMFHHTLGAGCLLAAVLLAPGWVRDWFDRPLWRFLGRISYGLYLTHFTVLIALPTWLVPFWAPSLGYLPAITLAFAMTLPVQLILAYCFSRGIDEPATRFAGQFATKMLAALTILRHGRPRKLELWTKRISKIARTKTDCTVANDQRRAG